MKTLLSLILLALDTAHGQVNYQDNGTLPSPLSKEMVYYITGISGGTFQDNVIAYRLPKPCIAMPNNVYVCSPFDKNYHEWRPYHGKHTRHNDSLGGGK